MIYSIEIETFLLLSIISLALNLARANDEIEFYTSLNLALDNLEVVHLNGLSNLDDKQLAIENILKLALDTIEKKNKQINRLELWKNISRGFLIGTNRKCEVNEQNALELLTNDLKLLEEEEEEENVAKTKVLLKTLLEFHSLRCFELNRDIFGLLFENNAPNLKMNILKPLLRVNTTDRWIQLLKLIESKLKDVCDWNEDEIDKHKFNEVYDKYVDKMLIDFVKAFEEFFETHEFDIENLRIDLLEDADNRIGKEMQIMAKNLDVARNLISNKVYLKEIMLIKINNKSKKCLSPRSLSFADKEDNFEISKISSISIGEKSSMQIAATQVKNKQKVIENDIEILVTMLLQSQLVDCTQEICLRESFKLLKEEKDQLNSKLGKYDFTEEFVFAYEQRLDEYLELENILNKTSNLEAKCDRQESQIFSRVCKFDSTKTRYGGQNLCENILNLYSNLCARFVAQSLDNLEDTINEFASISSKLGFASPQIIENYLKENGNSQQSLSENYEQFIRKPAQNFISQIEPLIDSSNVYISKLDKDTIGKRLVQCERFVKFAQNLVNWQLIIKSTT